MPDDLDQLKKHPSVLRLYTQKVKLSRNGPRFRGNCPLGTHSDTTPSFDVYPHADGTYLWKCLGCGLGGNIFSFIKEMDRISMGAAIKLVRDYVGGSPEHDAELVDSVFKSVGTAKPRVVLNLSDIEPYERALERNEAARNWLRGRGVTYETAKKLHTGYCQNIGRLIGANDKDVQDKGWLVFPVILGDKVVAIKFRSIVRKVFRRQTNMDPEALYNLNTIDMLEPVFLVEGELDAQVLEQAGFRAVSLPSASTRTSPEMKDLLLASEYVVLAGDCDNAVGTEKMKKLWAELGDRATLLEWPAGWKDANDTFLKECKGDIQAFQVLVKKLVATAKSVIMPGIYSLQDSMRSSHQSDLANHPERLRFPWANVDSMAILLPGDVAVVLATSTKQGKTTFVMNTTIDAALKHGEIVLNYQAELEMPRFNTNVAAYVLRKDRNHLTPQDIEDAANRLGNAKYYVGLNPSLSTAGPVLDLIEAAIRRLGITLAVIDHIHYICRNERDEIKAQADASQRIANMGRKYRCKIIVIGQPRKANQQSRGKRLQISDGKGSEAIYSDASAIYAIHRDQVKVVEPPPPDPYSPITEVHLLGGARSKGDGASEARLMFLGKYCCFAELANEPQDSGNQQGLF